jgi:hypothetical protein
MQRLFLSCFLALAGATLLLILAGSGYRMIAGGTLALMAIAVTCDFGPMRTTLAQ